MLIPRPRYFVSVLLALVLIFVVAAPGAAKKKTKFPEVSHDGLVLVPRSEFAVAYVHPEADWSGYERIQLLDAYVAFRKNWLRDHSTSLARPRKRDMERMKKDLAKLLRDVFRDELERDGGWPLVESTDDDVLLVRPAILDLDVTSPDTANPSRTYSFAASAGAATLMLEAYDSVTGEILARVLDRQEATEAGNFIRWTNRVTNRVAAERVLSGWAELLRERLDEVRSSGAP